MAKHSTRYLEELEKVDREETYTPAEALELLQDTASASFDETVELAVRFSLDTKQSDQQVRGAMVLPHGTGKEVQVIVFAEGEQAREAEEAGADIVGGEELAERIEEGWLDFDVVVSTPDMMRVVGRLGRILGPKGLMPSPKVGTVTPDLKQVIDDLKAGQIEYRADRTGNVHAPIGKTSFENSQLLENLLAVMRELIAARPPGAKGNYLKNIAVSSTMGPGIKIEPAAINTLVEKE